MAGVQIGLRDVHYAKLISDDLITGVVYEASVALIGAISANINPNASAETLFADDGPMETSSTIGQIELELNVARLSLKTQATLLGHTFSDSTKRMVCKAGDIPPTLAIGFRSLKSDGKYRYVWLLKGKFTVPEQTYETKGDTVAFQTPTITGRFLKRDFDDKYQLVGDSGETGFVATDWFKNTKINAS